MQDTKVKSKNSMLGKKPKPEKKGAAISSPSGQKSPNLSGGSNEGSKRMNKKRKANNSDTPNSGGNKKQKVEEFSGTKNLATPEGKTSEKKGEGKPRRHNKFSEYHKALERANSGIIARQTELRRLNDRIKELASRSKLSKTGRRKLANFRSLVAKLGNGNAPEAAQSEGIVQKLVNAKQAKKRKLKPEEKPDDSEGEEKDSDDEDSEEQVEDVKRTQKDKSQLEDSIEEESEDDSEDDEEDSADNENSKDDVKEFMDVEMKNGEEDSEEDDDDEEESDDDDDDSNKEMEEGNSTITEDDEDVKKPSVKAKNPEKKPKFEEKKSVNRNDTSFKRDSNNFSVFVANLSYEATKSDVEDVFSKLDGFVAVRMSRGTTPDKHKGFAFVEMKDQESYDVSF